MIEAGRLRLSWRPKVAVSGHRAGRTMRAAACALVMCLDVHSSAFAADRESPASMLQQSLRVGEWVTLRDVGALVEIQVLEGAGVGSHRVLRIDEAHVVLEDAVNVSRRWVPLSGIRAVVRTRLMPAPASSGGPLR